ncbi:MAG: energy transducer TonB [Nitrospirae bacterium]|nr:energy transducer TonB [Nitrospirota bacterium]
MRLRQSIVFSIVLHVTIIIAVFTVTVNGRDTGYRVPANYLRVSLLREVRGITSVTSQSTKKKEDENSNPTSPLFSKDAIKAAGTVRELSISQGIQSPVSRNTDMSVGIMSAHGTEYYTSKSQSDDKILRVFEGDHHKGGVISPYALIKAAIEKAKTYPILARKRKIEGTVIAVFTINIKGYPEDIRVEKSSGYEILDSTAIRIITAAAPFPKVNGEIVVPITFKLTESTASH